MQQTAFMIAGLAFGDEGKGMETFRIAQTYGAGLVVRYNGGAQAAHNVITDDGRHHTFAQFGSGTFVPGVQTHLSEYMLVHPQAMMREEEHLRLLGVTNALNRLTVHENALIITPFHGAANRLLEWSRGSNHHGSCGIGIGLTRRNHLEHGDKVLFARDLRSEAMTTSKLRFIQGLCLEMVQPHLEKLGMSEDVRAAISWLTRRSIAEELWEDYRSWASSVCIVPSLYARNLIQASETLIFEGAQGMGLDEEYGTRPHNTWTDITFGNALRLLYECPDGRRVRQYKIGCLRAYYTRHGAGPFPTENPRLSFPEPHNNDQSFAGRFRFGWFDSVLARAAIKNIGGIDEIALSCLDHIEQVDEVKIRTGENPERWETMLTTEPRGILRYVRRIGELIGARIGTVATGPQLKHRARLTPWPPHLSSTKTVLSSMPSASMPA